MSLPWHKSQSVHNKTTSDFLNTANPNHIDWEVTTLFYAALHLVDNYFQINNLPMPSNHDERKRLVRSQLPTLYSAFHKLYSLSFRARYIVGHRMRDQDRQIAVNSFTVLTTNLP